MTAAYESQVLKSVDHRLAVSPSIEIPARARQTGPASVLLREIAERGYGGAISQIKVQAGRPVVQRHKFDQTERDMP